jgi:hypothetical protein
MGWLARRRLCGGCPQGENEESGSMDGQNGTAAWLQPAGEK